MPEPIVICLEDLDADDLSRTYLQCSVLVGDEPGLRLNADGEVRWSVDTPLLELCVSQDDQLLVFLPAEAAMEAVLSREGRSLTIPAGKPVVALDGDVLALGGRRYQIHVHGAAPWEATPPRWLSPEELGIEPEAPRSSAHGAVTAAATALAVGAALSVGAVGCTKKVEVGDTPPKEARPPDAKPAAKPDAKLAATPEVQPDARAALPDAAKAGLSTKKTKKPPIQVRVRPPRMAPRPKPKLPPKLKPAPPPPRPSARPQPRKRPKAKKPRGLETETRLDRKGDD